MLRPSTPRPSLFPWQAGLEGGVGLEGGKGKGSFSGAGGVAVRVWAGELNFM